MSRDSNPECDWTLPHPWAVSVMSAGLVLRREPGFIANHVVSFKWPVVTSGLLVVVACSVDDVTWPSEMRQI